MLDRTVEIDRLLASLRRQPRTRLLVISFVLVALIGLADYASGPDVAFAVFYLAPITLAAYFVSDRAASWICVFSALVWSVADFTSGRVYATPLVGVWNGFTRLMIFLIVASLSGAARRAWEQQRDLANYDFLTGLQNRRAFAERLRREIRLARLEAHPFTVAYLDVDNFKLLNDYLGHGTGDELLRRVAEVIGEMQPDPALTARLGGDEFAILLPDHDHDRASSLIHGLHQTLSEEMTRRDWPVSFSIGVITCSAVPPDGDALIHQVDEIMYKAKREGKNRVKHITI